MISKIDIYIIREGTIKGGKYIIFIKESLMFFSKNPNQTSFFRLIFRFLLERDSLLKISGNLVAFTRLIKTIHN